MLGGLTSESVKVNRSLTHVSTVSDNPQWGNSARKPIEGLGVFLGGKILSQRYFWSISSIYRGNYFFQAPLSVYMRSPPPPLGDNHTKCD